MSSSDSEDDCYGNVVKTLQNLKNKYHEDTLDSANLLDISQENKELVNSDNRNVNQAIVLDTTISDDEEIDKIIALNSTTETTTKRKTRSSRLSNKNVESSISDTSAINAQRGRGTRSSRRGRGRGRGGNQASDASTTLDSGSPITPRSRGRNSARRGRHFRQSHNSYPTFSVGNCEDYEDLSNNVPLFTSNNKTTNVHAIEDDIFDENEELSVKVIWQSVDIVKFTIRKYQKITQIFDYFSMKANVTNDKLLFSFNDKILKPDDTPDTINYNIAKFIDGGIVSNNVSQLTVQKADTKQPDSIQIKFQYPNSKKAFEIYVSKDELLSKSMMKCAEHMEVPIKNLKFEFDGDNITGQMSARELDMEGGECIDVKIMS